LPNSEPASSADTIVLKQKKEPEKSMG